MRKAVAMKITFSQHTDRGCHPPNILNILYIAFLYDQNPELQTFRRSCISRRCFRDFKS